MTRTLRSLEVRTAQPTVGARRPGPRGAVGRDEGSDDPPDPPAAPIRWTQSLSAERLLLRLCLLFGALALLLACVGLYGVIAYAVAQRTNEIGLRVALGATPASVMRGVVRETLLLVVIGVAIGIPAALAAGRLLATFLYESDASGPGDARSSRPASCSAAGTLAAAAAGPPRGPRRPSGGVEGGMI